jgi:hypothetical protein
MVVGVMSFQFSFSLIRSGNFFTVTESFLFPEALSLPRSPLDKTQKIHLNAWKLESLVRCPQPPAFCILIPQQFRADTCLFNGEQMCGRTVHIQKGNYIIIREYIKYVFSHFIKVMGLTN